MLKRAFLSIFCVIGVSWATGCAAPAEQAPEQPATSTVSAEQALTQGAPSLPSDVQTALAQTGTLTETDLDRIYRVEHRVPLPGGRRIAMTETFTLRSWLRWPHRAMLMIPAQGSNRSVYNVPVAGYDGGAIMAKQGFFAFTADPEGTGESTYPENGSTVTYESEAASLLLATQYIRLVRLVPRVDALGEELGGGVAMHLCANKTVVRSCVAASMIYKTGSEFFNAAFNSPFFREFILGSPDGYFYTFPEAYFNVLAGASPDVRDWYLSTQIGRYANGLYKQDYERLYNGGNSYNPTFAAVPGLIIRGELDPNNSIEDVQALANAYGSAVGAAPAEIKVIAGGSHIVRLDAPPRGPQFWDLVKEFVERPSP